MKNKIALKLTIYFTISLLVFGLIIGGVFMMLFRKQTLDLYKSELEAKAKNVSETIISLLDSDTTKGQGQGQGQSGGFRVYIKFLNEFITEDVWIVDANYELITVGQGITQPKTAKDLPIDAEDIIKDAFLGNASFSEGFSTYFESPALTIGAPIIDENSNIIGVVLLHSPVKGIQSATNKGITILLISIATAMILAVIISIGFSITFTKPLKKMKNNAVRLTHGEFTVRNDINQNDEIGELADKLDVLAERLYISSKDSENLEQLRKDFVANISHELKTPVTVIRASLEAFIDGIVTDPEKANEYHIQMLEETKGLQRLVGELLDLSRLQNTDFKMEMSSVDIVNVMNDAIKSAKNISSEKKIEFMIEILTNEIIVTGDHHRLRQMFMTVLDNAVRFSLKQGNIYIKIYKNEGLIISIRDEGAGISKEELPYIFDRFHKTKDKSNKDGTGLGLAIAKQIAQGHDINISVNSELGKGSEFIFEFMDI